MALVEASVERAAWEVRAVVWLGWAFVTVFAVYAYWVNADSWSVLDLVLVWVAGVIVWPAVPLANYWWAKRSE